jgi:hypothetical protein
VDISGTPSALLLALLAAHGQQAVYVPGRTVNRMSGAYRGEAKTDARDAYVIAETARHRRDFATNVGVHVNVPPRRFEWAYGHWRCLDPQWRHRLLTYRGTSCPTVCRARWHRHLF